MRYFIFMIVLIFSSCSPNMCPELSMKKPNYYVEKYLTYYDGKEYTGRCTVYNLDTLRSIQQYKNGYDHGKWKFYHSNGRIETKATFNMGKREGKWKYFYDNGNLRQVSNYKDGLREGIWFRLDIKGDTLWVEKYINDEVVLN